MYLQLFITLCNFVSLCLLLFISLVNCSGSKQKLADQDKTNIPQSSTQQTRTGLPQSNVESQQPNSTGTSVTVQSTRDKTIQKIKIDPLKEAVKHETAPKTTNTTNRQGIPAKDELLTATKNVEVKLPLPAIKDMPKIESVKATTSPIVKKPSPKNTTVTAVKKSPGDLRKQSIPVLTMKSQPSSSSSRQPAKEIGGSPKQPSGSSKAIPSKDLVISSKALKKVNVVESGMQAQADAKSLPTEPTNMFSPCSSAKGEVPEGPSPQTPPLYISIPSVKLEETESKAKLKSEKIKSEKTTTISTENKTPANVVDAEPVSENSQQSRSIRALVASRRPREMIRKKRQNKSPPKERSRSDQSRSVHDDEFGAVEQIEI